MALLFQCSLKNMRAIETRDIRLHSADLVGQDGILRAGWQPALGGHLQTPAGGVPNCPTSQHLPSRYFARFNNCVTGAARRSISLICAHFGETPAMRSVRC